MARHPAKGGKTYGLAILRYITEGGINYTQ